MNDSTRRYIAEAIGTFTLVFVGTAVAVLQGYFEQGAAGWLGIALAFGFTLLVLVLAIGPVSGCHVNPAVSLGALLAGRMKAADFPGYVIAQCAGAIAASGVLLVLLRGLPDYGLAAHGLGANGNAADMHLGALLGFELVMTALFMMTILAVTRADAGLATTKSPAFAAPAIGGFLFVAHLVGVPLGDASLNPARSLGPAVFVAGEAMRVLWVFIVGPAAGAILGVALYKAMYRD